jgi:dolichyl-phosphate beta-glucosyltransferase
MRSTKTAIVIPCYNEENRLQPDVSRDFLIKNDHIRLLFVNDGSTDGTAEILDSLTEKFPHRCKTIHLEKNRGKADAVRRGILEALSFPCKYAGYWDADFSTPLAVVNDFSSILDTRPDLYMVFGSRVLLLGRSIERSPFRHYLGRVFATAASMLLDLKVYDTQCGAKLFRACPEVRRLFEPEFMTRWVFDVEIIARWIKNQQPLSLPPAEEVIYEYALKEWRHVKGSKIGLVDAFSILSDLITIYRQY